ncbi:ribbon-helix-helix domain-containing protein [Promethearchaeum syntrophicum]|uniref:Ribbon-helix-helix domain-containing protein n=1 Tax=Promethearchaeum syntrophicum TaxID=2594042 RepID=A0AC61ZTX2_9ARCH
MWGVFTIRIITCNVPESYLRAIEKITGKKKIYPSRSELIRIAIREWVIKELESAKAFEEFQTKPVLYQDEYLLEKSKNVDKVVQQVE